VGVTGGGAGTRRYTPERSTAHDMWPDWGAGAGAAGSAGHWLFAAVGRPLSAGRLRGGRGVIRRHFRTRAATPELCVLPPDSAVAPLLSLGEARPRVVLVGMVTLPSLYHAISFGNVRVMPLNMWWFARTIHH
jgi:hypothetical protein